jgi:hypothetical protein
MQPSCELRVVRALHDELFLLLTARWRCRTKKRRGPLSPQPTSADGKLPPGVRPHPKSRKPADECVALEFVPYVCLIETVICRTDSTNVVSERLTLRLDSRSSSRPSSVRLHNSGRPAAYPVFREERMRRRETIVVQGSFPDFGHGGSLSKTKWPPPARARVQRSR